MKTTLMTLITAFLAFSAAAVEYPMHARVSFDQGNTMVKGAEDAEWSQAPNNTLILPGDVLWSDVGGMTELEFAGGSFVRQADGSKAELVTLPPSGAIKAWNGSFYVHRLDRSTGEFLLETPVGTVQVDKDTAVRVDVEQDGASTVSVRWGAATVLTSHGGGTLVRGGERTWIDPGLLPSSPMPFDMNVQDDFDVWNATRVKLLTGSGKTIPKTVNIHTTNLGYSDLSSTGEWFYVDDRPYWRPTVVTNYVPYRQGHWSYVHGAGHVWVGNHPFSYVTSHYGRWQHHSMHGWMWSYDPVWSPAWVATVRCGDYYVWTPVDYYNRPVMVRQSAYFSLGGVRFGIATSTFVPVRQVYFGASYVSPCSPTIVSYVHRRPTQVNIWNINIGSRNHVRVPYSGELAGRVRNYAPRRHIRGPQRQNATVLAASVRVGKLEGNAGRSRFSTVQRRELRDRRTTANATRRSAATSRQVALRGKDTSYARAVRSNTDLARATQGRATTSSSRRGATTTTATASRGRSAPSGTTRVSREVDTGRTHVRKPAPTRSQPRVATVDMDRTPSKPAPSQRGTSRMAPANPRTAPPSTRTARTQPRTTSTRSSAPRTVSNPSRSTSSRTVSSPSRPASTPTRNRQMSIPAPRRYSATSTMPRPSASMRTSTPSRSQMTTPSRKPAPAPSMRQTRVSTPSASPTPRSVSLPSRSTQRSVSAPSRSSSRASSGGYSSPAPRASSARSQAPSRSSSRSSVAAPRSTSSSRSSSSSSSRAASPSPSRSRSAAPASSSRGSSSRRSGR
jgi:hypothetical protein